MSDPGSPPTGPGSPGIPWLPVSFVARFESWPTTGWTVFEWGTGWSTLWFARRVGPTGHVFTVEHDAYWVNRVRAAAEVEGLNNITFHLFERDEKTTNVKDAAAYAKAIWKAAGEQPSGKFDCVFVDGVERDLCVEFALPYVGKVLVWDNASQDKGGRNLIAKTDMICRVEQWDSAVKRHDFADTWYWSAPSFREGYEGLPPSPHLKW